MNPSRHGHPPFFLPLLLKRRPHHRRHCARGAGAGASVPVPPGAVCWGIKSGMYVTSKAMTAAQRVNKAVP